MKPTRRRFQYSLRTFLVLLTALAVWLGVAVNRAREQREAVEVIKSLGGSLLYDRQFHPGVVMYRGRPVAPTNVDDMPDAPAWIRQLVGDEFFEKVVAVSFLRNPEIPEDDILESIPCLQRLRVLSAITLPYSVSRRTENELKAALPKCKFYRTYNDP